VYFERGELARARELIAEAQTLAPASNEIAHWYSVIMGFKPD
jgi:hypothetical protein